MRCNDCYMTTAGGDRYFPHCGAYISAKPGPIHRDLSLHSPDALSHTLEIGLPLIWKHVSTIWEEARRDLNTPHL